MCGIFGFITDKKIDINKLMEMNKTMENRGPDDNGVELFESNGNLVGMAHNRLSILDLSMMGHQPMYSYNKRFCIVFNGEIYNYRELYNDLNYPFLSSSDTEVILASYIKWGKDCVKYFKGMFAFAIYDKEENELFMARDHIGKKPLYYWLTDNQIVFSSQLGAIIQFPQFERDIKKEVLGGYLLHGYIASPQTIYKNVYKLEAGCTLTYKDSKNFINKFYDVFDLYNLNKNSYKGDYIAAKNELKSSIQKSISYRLVSDVPVGCFLSGGYDSTLIAALAQEIKHDQLNTFSIGFMEGNYNEAEYAKQVANILGTKHNEYYVSDKDAVEKIHLSYKYYEEVFADSSLIPMLILSEYTKKHVSVVLSGDGGDELFCGYNFYDLLPKIQKLDKFGKLSYNIMNKLNLMNLMPYKVREIAMNRNANTKTQVGFEGAIKLCNDLVGRSVNEKYFVEEQINENSWQIRRMLLDMKYYLPDDILCKVDRATMAYSLEARAPLLDIDVIKLAFQFPHKFKYDNSNKKKILKDIVYDYVPQSVMERPKKGFSAPRDKWMRTIFKEELLQMSRKDVLKKQGIFDPLVTERLIDSYIQGKKSFELCGNCTNIVWGFYIFQLWYQQYLG